MVDSRSSTDCLSAPRHIGEEIVESALAFEAWGFAVLFLEERGEVFGAEKIPAD